MASSKGRTPPERILLAELDKEFPDIEDKGYDGRSLHKKERAWSQLLSWFNAANPSGQKRNLKQIQGCWKRFKLNAKKDFDFQCRESMKTGGGKAPPSPDEVF